MKPTSENLKQRLKSIGFLSEAAWEAINQGKQEQHYKKDRPIKLLSNGVIYLADGLLKQYNSKNRVKPSINRFIIPGQHLFIPHIPDHYYVKCLMDSQLWCWGEEQVKHLLAEYPPLLRTERLLRDEHEALLDFRLQLLESPASERLSLFKAKYGRHVAFIKRRDLANYLHLNYSYMSQISSL